MVTFCIAIIGFVIGSEWIVRTQVAPKSKFDALRERLYTSQAAYGGFADSRGANGLRARPGFENFSMAGDNLITIVEKARFFARSKTAKGLVLQADPHHFSSYRLNRDQSQLRADLFSRSTAGLQFLRPVYRQYLLSYWQAFLEQSLFPPSAKPPRQTTIPRFSDLSPEAATTAASIRTGLQTPIKAIAQTSFSQAYESTVRDLKQSGIQVCMVTFPVSAPYRKIAMAEPAYGAALEYYKTVAKRSAVQYVNLTAAFPDRLFADPDHLNSEGAKVLTDRLLNSCFGLTP